MCNNKIIILLNINNSTNTINIPTFLKHKTMERPKVIYLLSSNNHNRIIYTTEYYSKIYNQQPLTIINDTKVVTIKSIEYKMYK